MIDQADQPRLAGMGALLGQMTFGSITSSLFNSARSLLSALLGCCLIDSSSKMRDAGGGV